MFRPALAFVLTMSLAGGATAQATLDIYFIDVEGGQSTLIVSPAGESLLIDTGWAGNDGRDTRRILAAAKAAGVRVTNGRTGETRSYRPH